MVLTKGRPKLSYRCVDQATGQDISDQIADKPQIIDEREFGRGDDRRDNRDRRDRGDRDDRGRPRQTIKKIRQKKRRGFLVNLD